MAESSLSLKLTEIQARLGVFAGWGRGALYSEPAWNSYQQAALDDAVQSGLRRFYYPEPQEGSRESYSWSFLRPFADLALASGDATIDLPDDFGCLDGGVYLMLPSGGFWGEIMVKNPSEVDGRHACLPNSTGRPVMASIQWLKDTTAGRSQRAQLYVWPKADGDYTLRLRYTILPDYLDPATAPYALGGMAHIETVLESCMAVLEERLDDASGVHAQAFSRRLLASISMDRKSKAQNLGENRDMSGGIGRGRWWGQTPALYQGGPY